MRVAFIGADPVGTVLATRLAAAGHDITVQAQGGRLWELRAFGMLVQEPSGGPLLTPPVSVVEALQQRRFDLVVLAGPDWTGDDVDLFGLPGSPPVAWLTRVPPPPAGSLRDRLQGRLVALWPGFDATQTGPAVTCSLLPGRMCESAVGPLVGEPDQATRICVAAIRLAGFRAAAQRDMQEYLESVATLTIPLAAARLAAAAQSSRLEDAPDLVTLAALAVCEGVRALRARSVPLRWWWLRAVELLPDAGVVGVAHWVMSSRRGPLRATGLPLPSPGPCFRAGSELGLAAEKVGVAWAANRFLLQFAAEAAAHAA